MNIFELAAMTAYYGNDQRVTKTDNGYVVRDDVYEWAVLRHPSADFMWWAYTRNGVAAAGPFDTVDEVIYDLIGEPQ